MKKKVTIAIPGASGKMVAELTVGYRRSGCERKAIRSSDDTMQMIKETFADWEKDTHIERFHVILLNRANRPIAYQMISQGSINGTVADPRQVMLIAVQFQVSAIILVHNHPSGQLVPSQSDIEMTRRLADAGKILEVHVLDHIIYAPNETGDDFKHYSFADEGQL